MDHSIRQPRKWSLAEDQKLREEVEAQRKLFLLRCNLPSLHPAPPRNVAVSQY
jgi:hypothetical protein